MLNTKASEGRCFEFDARRSSMSERCSRVGPIEPSSHLASEILPFSKKPQKDACTTHGKNEAMESEGRTEMKAGRWRREFAGATGMMMPPVGGVTKRITRDSDTKALIEDLWSRGRTQRDW